MATTTPANSPTPSDTDRRFIGTDGEGFDHHRIRDGSVVVVDSTGTRVDRADGVDINDWIDAITERDGWERRELFSTFGDAVTWKLHGGDA